MEEYLYIPSGLKLQPEIFEGFGIKELKITFIVGVITIVSNLLVYSLHNNIAYAVFAILIIMTATVMCLSKNQYNLSVVDQIKFMINFAKVQKKYKYKHCKEHNYEKYK